MSIKSVALALNEFDKTVKSIRDAQLKAALERHIKSHDTAIDERAHFEQPGAQFSP